MSKLSFKELTACIRAQNVRTRIVRVLANQSPADNSPKLLVQLTNRNHVQLMKDRTLINKIKPIRDIRISYWDTFIKHVAGSWCRHVSHTPPPPHSIRLEAISLFCKNICALNLFSVIIKTTPPKYVTTFLVICME